MELKATKTEKTEGSHSLQFHTPKVTGKLCFQFDEDEPFEMADIADNSEVNLKLSSPVVKEGEAPVDSAMSFEKGGKKFRLFIKAV